MPDAIVAPSPTAIEDSFYPTKTDVTADPSTVTVIKPSETPAKAGAVKTVAESEPADTELEPIDPKSKSPRQSFAELRTARDKAEARAELLEKQLGERNKPAESLPAKPAAEVKPVDGKPKSEDFATYDEFLDARDTYNRKTWEDEQAVKTNESKAAEAKTQQEAKSAKHLENWNKRETDIQALHETYKPTFDVFLATAKSNTALATAVFESEFGPDLAQRLGANPDELARIAALEPRAIWKEIGKLEDKLSASKVPDKTITKAPRPLATVSGNAGGPAKETSMEDRFYPQK